MKKGYNHIRQKLSNEQCQTMITELSRVHPISKLTKIFEVPKTTYYYRKLNKLTVNKILKGRIQKKLNWKFPLDYKKCS